jgi:hypothetical protein
MVLSAAAIQKIGRGTPYNTKLINNVVLKSTSDTCAVR